MAEPQEYNIADCKEKLKGLDAFFYENMENTDQVLLGDSELNIAWKVSAPDLIPPLRYFLENYTWHTNTEKQKWIENPEIRGKVVEGKWRQAFVRDVKRTEKGTEIYYIILTLRRGYITTLLASASAAQPIWTEARLEQDRQMPGGTSPGSTTASEFLIVKWNNVSPDKVDTIKGELEGLDADGFAPEIRGQSYGTSFHRLYVASGIEDDGSGTITMLLAQPEFSLASFQSYGTSRYSDVDYYWDVPRKLAQAIITAAVATGKSVIPSYNQSQGLVDLVIYTRDYTGEAISNTHLASTCDYDVYGWLYWGISNPASYNIENDYSQGNMYTREVQSNGDGSYDVFIRRRVARARDYGLNQTLESILTERYELIQLNVKTASTVVSLASVPAGTIYRRNITPNDDCTGTYTTTYDYGVYAHVPATMSMSHAFEDAYDRIVRNASVPVGVSEYVQGCIYQGSPTLNDFGLYDLNERIRLGRPFYGPQISIASMKSENDYVMQYRNISVQVNVPAHAQGYMYRSVSSVNEFYLYDSDLSIRKANTFYLTGKKTAASRFENDYTDMYRNNLTYIEAPAHVQGSIYRADQVINDFGTYDATISSRNAVPGYMYDLQFEATGLHTGYLSIYRNALVSIPAPSHTQGFIYRSDCSLNDFGEYDSHLAARAAVYIDIPDHGTLQSGLFTETTHIYRNSPTMYSLSGDAPVYTIYRSNNSFNDFGTYDVEYSARVSTPAEIKLGFYTSNGDGWIKVFRNRRVDQMTNESLLEGVYNPSISIGINDDLTYNGTAVYNPSRYSSDVFAGAGCSWVSNDYSYDKSSGNWLYKTQTNYRYFFATRQGAANAMAGQCDCSDPGLPRYVHGLWEAIYNNKPEVGHIAAS